MNKKTPMKPDEIRGALAKRGIQQSGLARDLDVVKSVISQVITGKTVSYRVQCHIAKAIGRPVEEVFTIKPNPTRKGRPLGRGLFHRREHEKSL